MAINLEKMESLLQLKNKVFITFDIDWAPDHMVNHVIDLCIQFEISATFFATHFCETLTRLRNYPELFEIGLHPNFLPGSTQGTTEKEVFDYCKKLVPDALSVRTHCVYQHGRLYGLLNKNFGERIIDSSICMPGLNNIQPFELYTTSGCLVKVPFFWADDYYLLGKQKLDPNNLLNADGCKVYMFHPVHIYQNTKTIEEYEKRKQNQPDINDCDRNSVDGIGFLFENFIKNIKQHFSTGLMKNFLEFNAAPSSNLIDKK